MSILWGRRESNPHALRHVILSHACLPVPALPLSRRLYHYLLYRSLIRKRRFKTSPGEVPGEVIVSPADHKETHIGSWLSGVQNGCPRGEITGPVGHALEDPGGTRVFYIPVHQWL